MQEFTARRAESKPLPEPAKQPANSRRNRLVGFACAGVAVLSLLASDGLLRAAALVGAGLALPQGADTLLYPAAEAASEVTQQALEGTPPQKIVLADTKAFDIAATPKDIEVFMEEALSELAGQRRDGDIKRKTYTAKDATHAWGRLTVRNTTKTQANRDLSKDLEAPIGLQLDKGKPAVLIFHTHTTEGFEIIERPWYAADWSSRTENGAKSIVRVGTEMAKALERAGWQVIHDTNIYDRQYTGAYDKSRAAVLKHLEENPGILVTLDVHRDAIHTDKGVHIKPAAEIGGKDAAQVMIITGLREGAIAGYADWEENLRFAVKLHMVAEERYPGLMRPLFFAPRKYNMDVTPYSLLLEMGADANTLEEAAYSGRLIGDALAGLLEGYTVDN
ncbi:MAG: stage II sporulation protein P [Firmicutes bacterium]|nr:stage II sporulation protein P [Bacillota bacterium]